MVMLSWQCFEVLNTHPQLNLITDNRYMAQMVEESNTGLSN